MSEAVDKLLGALDKVKKSGQGSWRAVCPACGGKNNTKLSIKEGSNGGALVKCFAGCSIDEIVSAAGLQITDLFPPKTDHGKPTRHPFRYEAMKELKGDLNVVWIFLNDIARGNPLTDADRRKAGEYGRRVANLLQEVA